MNRRAFIAAGVATATAGLAGCRSLFETRSSRVPPLVDDRPDAVYYPTHVEGMQMVGTADAGDYRVALTYSFPHRFWLVDGDSTNKVGVEDGDSVHLMTTVWDAESGQVVPNNSVSVTITADGDPVDSGRMWPMLSQNMGVHAGDNFELDGDATYDVEVRIEPFPDRTTGGFADRFGDIATASFSLEFSQSTLDETTFERLTNQEGDRGAVDPMEMDMVPVAGAPAPGEMPGTVLGEASDGDAAFVAAHLDEPPAGIDGDDGDGADGDGADGDGGGGDGASDGTYLAVSPRTPYNGYPLAFMGLSAAVTRDGESVFDDRLSAALDPDLGYHYGAVVPGIESGDEVAVAVDTAPQLARHEGYETAFFDFSGVSFTT